MRLINTVLIVMAVQVLPLMATDDLQAVHEWGTFTSVAGADGTAMSWQALAGPSDLPCFVHRLDQSNLKVAAYGSVRMETPVLYFYPLKPLTVSVHVNFPAGRVTEWYPQASSVQPSISRQGWIRWDNVRVGDSAGSFPVNGKASHYYASRTTDSWTVRSRNESEKLLFYRGIGDFDVDLNAVVKDGGVAIRNGGTDTIPLAILFQNHAGQIGYRIIRGMRGPVDLQFSELSGSLDHLRTDLEAQLIEMGLYRKEAHAMVETWRDSWFEEGLRVFYLLPRSKVDTVLPITIQPAPAQLTRVFVGRVELLAPWMRQEIDSALANGNVPVLQKYGRFLNAFMAELEKSNTQDVSIAEPARLFLRNSYLAAQAESLKRACTE